MKKSDRRPCAGRRLPYAALHFAVSWVGVGGHAHVGNLAASFGAVLPTASRHRVPGGLMV